MAQAMVAAAAHTIPPFPLPALPRIRPPATPKGTPGPNATPLPLNLPPTNQIWADGKLQSPSSPSAKHRSAIVSKQLEKALKHEVLGMNIYAYKHVRTGQVVYSLTNNMDNNKIMKQLIFHGKKTVPAALRRDVWRPYFMVRMPRTPAGAAKGMGIYQDLRELSKWRQLDPPREMKLNQPRAVEHENTRPKTIVGTITSQKLIAMRLLHQERHAVADLSAVLARWNREKVQNKHGKVRTLPTPRARLQRQKEQRERDLATMSERKREFELLKDKNTMEKEEDIKSREELLHVVPGQVRIDKHTLARISTEYDGAVDFVPKPNNSENAFSHEPSLDLFDTIVETTAEEDKHLVALEKLLKEREEREESLYNEMMGMMPESQAELAKLPEAEQKEHEAAMEAEVTQKMSELEFEAEQRRDALNERKERLKEIMIGNMKIATNIEDADERRLLKRRWQSHQAQAVEKVAKLPEKSRDIRRIKEIDFKELKDNKKLVKKLSTMAIEFNKSQIRQLNQIHLDQRYESLWWQKQSQADSLKWVGPYARIGDVYRKELKKLREAYEPEIARHREAADAQKEIWADPKNHAVEVCFANIQDAYHAQDWPKHVTFGKLENKAVVLQKTNQVRTHEHFDEDEKLISTQSAVTTVPRANSVHVFGAASFADEPERYIEPSKQTEASLDARKLRTREWKQTISILAREELLKLREACKEIQDKGQLFEADELVEPNTVNLLKLRDAAFSRISAFHDQIKDTRYWLEDTEQIVKQAYTILPLARAEAVVSGDAAKDSRMTWLEHQFRIARLIVENPKIQQDADLRERYFQLVDEWKNIVTRQSKSTERGFTGNHLTDYYSDHPYIRQAVTRLTSKGLEAQQNGGLGAADELAEIRGSPQDLMDSPENAERLAAELKKDSSAWVGFKETEESFVRRKRSKKANTKQGQEGSDEASAEGSGKTPGQMRRARIAARKQVQEAKKSWWQRLFRR